jgi:uncharacterized OB-fold protein
MAELLPQPGPLPIGPPGRDNAPFWAGAAEGELRYVRCTACGRADFPAAPHCRFCLEYALAWEVSAGLGSVYSYTIVWRPVTPDFVTPYAPAVVLLDEGYAMMTNLIGLDTEDVKVDQRVRVDFADVSEGPTLPYFRPVA